MEFAQWVRAARAELGKPQKELAKKAGIRQQDWSKFERLGLVPGDEDLPRLCKALGKEEADARKVLSRAETVDQRVHWYQLDLQAFRQDLIQRDSIQRAQNPNQAVQVFVIRDDSVPVDDVVVGLHDDILRQSCVRLSVLFRYDDPQVWDSFLSLAKALADRWTADDCDLNDLRSRLRGYYAHPKAEENKKLALPMAHSILLIVDSTGPSLYNYDVNPEVAARQQQAGHSDEDAQRQALVLLPGWKDKARLIAGWAGARRTPGLDPNRWVEIDWSPLPST